MLILTEQPKIAQAFIQYLAPSEIFLHNQFRYLRRYYPLVLAITPYLNTNIPRFPQTEFYNPDQGHTPIDRGHFVKWFGEQLTAQNFTAVHAHGAYAGILFSFTTQEYNLPLIVSFMGRDISASARDPLYRVELQLLFRRASQIIALSTYMYNQLIDLGCPVEKTKRIRRGIDLKIFNNSSHPAANPDSICVLFAGRFTPKKGLHTLIEAVSRCRQRDFHVKLQLIGSGEMLATLQHYVQLYKLEDYVDWLGWQSQPRLAQYMRSAHIFCHPSETAPDGDMEGIPNVIKEAMAMQLPVISTSHAGIPELVIHEQTGLLVIPADAEALSVAIGHLIEAPEKRFELGEAAREFVIQHYDIVKQNMKLELLYDEALSQQ